MTPLIYMKLLWKVVRIFGLWYHQFAYDTQLYLTLSSDPKMAAENLNPCLEAIIGWMRANKLMLHPDKMDVILRPAGTNRWVVHLLGLSLMMVCNEQSRGHISNCKGMVQRPSIEKYVNSLSIPVLSKTDEELCNAPITTLEILRAIESLKTNKTPGPDGYTAKCY